MKILAGALTTIALAVLAALFVRGERADRPTDAMTPAPQRLAAQDPPEDPIGRISLSSSQVSSSHTSIPDPSAELEPSAPTGTVRLNGVVRLRNGTRAAGAKIEVTSQGKKVSTRCSSSGEYEFDSIDRGDWSILVQLQHAGDFMETFDASLLEDTVERDFTLCPLHRVLVVLLDPKGNPLVKNDVLEQNGLSLFMTQFIATERGPSSTDFTAEGLISTEFSAANKGYFASSKKEKDSGPSGTRGAFYFRDGPPAWMSFVVNGRVLGCERVLGTTRQVTFVTTHEEIEATFARVRGRVLAAQTGKPERATVMITQPGSGGRFYSIQVDEEGYFSIALRLPGETVLTADLEGFARVAVPVTLVSGEVVDLGTILMHEPVMISGWIAHFPSPEKGKVLISVQENGNPRSVSPESYKVLAPGPFEITGLNPGEYTVQIRNTGNAFGVKKPYVSTPQLVDTTRGSVGGIRLTPQAPTKVTLQYEPILELPLPTVSARAANGLIAESRPIQGSSSSLQLPPGAYRLEVASMGKEMRTQNLIVGAESKAVKLNLD